MAAGDLGRVLSQLGTLTTRLERVERAQAEASAQVGQGPGEALDEVRAQLADLAAQFEQLTGLVGAAVDQDTGPDGPRVTPIWWPALSDDESATAARELRGWLRDVLAARYPRDAAKLTPCWARHPQAVDLLTALWVTWAAGLLARGADARDAAEWHVRWRVDLIDAVRSELSNCAKGHQPPAALPSTLLASFEP